MNRMKCVSSILLSGVLSLALVGCNTGNQEQSQTVNTADTTESVVSGVSEQADNSVDEAYIKSMFTDEQINKEGIELNQLPADYHFVTMADLCAGRCTAGEKVYTVGLLYEDNGEFDITYQISQIFYSSIISSFANILLKNLSLSEKNRDKIYFNTSRQYGSLNFSEPIIACIFGEALGASGALKLAYSEVSNCDIAVTGTKALSYLKKYSDKKIENNYKQKCVETEESNKYVKVSGKIVKSDNNSYVFMIKNNKCNWYLDRHIYGIGERELTVGDIVTLYGYSRKTTNGWEPMHGDDYVSKEESIKTLYLNFQYIEYKRG